jgi:hypothetical protein
MSIPGAAPSTAASPGTSGRPKEASSPGLGRLVALWYAGLITAAVLVHCALGNAESTILAAILLAAAVVVPLTLLGYTLRVHGAALNSQILVPAIGPIVIGVLIFEYVEYNGRCQERPAERRGLQPLAPPPGRHQRRPALVCRQRGDRKHRGPHRTGCGAGSESAL